MDLQQRTIAAFTDLYEEAPALVVRAPGRVNLIGEHTDYNAGFVLPMAIDRAVWIALRPRRDGYVLVHALELDETGEFSLAEMTKRKGEWLEYIKGVAWALQEAGHDLPGWEGVIASDVPIGASLSSSAAIELATARAFASLAHLDWDPTAMALLCQKAENAWVGVNSGIMDQMISASGREGEALLIDCRDLSTKSVPLPPDTVIVVMDTMTRHDHTTGGYNTRVKECLTAADLLNVKTLRDADLPLLEAARDRMNTVIYRRARHVISENQRTLDAADAMLAGDAGRLGVLMNASHASLHEDYEVTNLQTDIMARIAQSAPGCYGARMTGGGFGGCCVALVNAAQVDAFTRFVNADYTRRMVIDPAIYVCRASDGAGVVTQ